MGCFTVLKGKKKKSEQPVFNKSIKPKENAATVLPEPQNQSRSLQSAPPSFKARNKPIQPVNHATSSRIRALSAPSSLHVGEREALAAMEYEEPDESKVVRGRLSKDRQSPSPHPLPLPSPQRTNILMNMGSFKSADVSGLISASGPLPLPPLGGIKNFTYEEIASACQNFSPDRCMSGGLSSTVYKASFGDDTSTFKRLEATVTRLLPSTQGFKEFMNEINILANLQHPQLCKLLGFYAREGSEQRMLVYERLFHGSLDHLLYSRSDGPPIDWATRMKVALCAAQGLAFLHEEGPFQAMYNEFSTSNIQIDKDFSAKLSGYGCVSYDPDAEISNCPTAVANLSVETLERGLLTPKSNVWSFGVILLELLTGRKNLDCQLPKEERNLVKWSRPFLVDDCRLTLIMDPRLKGRFPAKAARMVADVALKCLQKEPSERPTMRTIAEYFKNIQDLKYSRRFPLQEPSTVAGKQMLRSPSLNGIVVPAPRINSPSPSRIQPSVSPTRPSMPASLPPISCSSVISFEEIQTQDCQRTTMPTSRRAGVEGF